MEKRYGLIFFLIGLIAITIIAGCVDNKDIKSTSEYTIAYISDARPSKDVANNTNNLTEDFTQIIPQSPTKRVDAVIMLGDMDYINQTSQAYAESTAKDIPVFYVRAST